MEQFSLGEHLGTNKFLRHHRTRGAINVSLRHRTGVHAADQ